LGGYAGHAGYVGSSSADDRSQGRQGHDHGHERGDYAARVLVVDDEPAQVEIVRSYLEAEQYEVLSASDGLAALEIARSRNPDLVVLDVMLPGLDGVEVCRQLRQFSDAYVIMLTARSEEIDKIIGLSVGADDYLTKPFSPRELVARVKAMLRRPRSSGPSSGLSGPSNSSGKSLRELDTPPPIVAGDLRIDLAGHEVLCQGEPMNLTPREYDLLVALASHPGRLFTRDQLLQQVWQGDYYDDHVVDSQVVNLRRKLGDDPSNPMYIETVRGAGYRFKAPPRVGAEESREKRT
jgi:two-component system, OmpR family, alkaline phosphatase synthesis response regulator PhoP